MTLPDFGKFALGLTGIAVCSLTFDRINQKLLGRRKASNATPESVVSDSDVSQFKQRVSTIACAKPSLQIERPIILLSSDADASTFRRKFAKVLLDELLRDAVHPAANTQLRIDASRVLKWLGTANPNNITTKQRDKFANGYIQYLLEGVSPSDELSFTFAAIRKQLLEITPPIKDLGPVISDGIRRVFDRLFATDAFNSITASNKSEEAKEALHSSDALVQTAISKIFECMENAPLTVFPHEFYLFRRTP